METFYSNPCVFEAMGGISPPSNNLLRRLAKDLKLQMKKPYGYIMNLLKKKKLFVLGYGKTI